MKITRTINGVEFSFELLPKELIDAFYEQQEKFDIEDIIYYANMFDSNEFKEEFGCTYDEFMEMKEEMASEMRRNMDKYDMEFSYARQEAVRDVLQRNKAMA